MTADCATLYNSNTWILENDFWKQEKFEIDEIKKQLFKAKTRAIAKWLAKYVFTIFDSTVS